MWFKQLAALGPGGQAAWHVTELARAASAAAARPYTSQAASKAVKSLARDGLAARTHNNREAPWALTAAGTAKAHEMGYLPAAHA